MKNLRRTDTLLLQELIRSEGKVASYTLHRKFRLSPSEVVRSINKLKEMEIIDLDGFNIKFTQQGRDWVVRNRFQLFSPGERPWRKCPEHFVQQKLMPNQPYVPRISKLDKSLRISE